MTFTKVVTLLLLAQCVAGARKLRGNQDIARGAKSLVNTFPFNANEREEDHHEHHEHHEEHAAREPSQSLDTRFSRQGEDEAAVDFAAVAEAGEKCIDKVEMVEETEYDDVIQCDHSYDKRCHTTYVTNYASQQEEECEENFKKSCFIEYEKIALQETVNVCRKPLVKDCEVEGPEICRTEYESECWTKQKKACQDETSGYTTNTKCSKWPKEVC